MEKLTRRRYLLEYKQEAVRLVASGQRVSAAAKALGNVEQALANWVKADKAGQLRGRSSEQFSAERMVNNRLRAALAVAEPSQHARAASHDGSLASVRVERLAVRVALRVVLVRGGQRTEP